MRTTDVARSAAFMLQVGMRDIFRGDDVAVMELRGGTHLVLLRDAGAVPGEAGFDLMVEDLQAMHRQCRSAGYPVTDIEHGAIHDSFSVTEPAGNRITFNSTHVEDHQAV
jgi:hypothetical protein